MIEFIKNIFNNQDVFIVGGGPSLIGFNFKRLDDKKVIAVNHSYEYIRNTSLLCYLDLNFLYSLRRKCHKIEHFPFPVLTGPQGSYHAENCYTVRHCKDPKENNDNQLYGSITSVAFSISAALYGGAKKIYLLGIDLFFNDMNNKHFYSKDFEKRKLWTNGKDPSQQDRLDRMKKSFEKFEPYKDKIINLSTNSKLEIFEKKKLVEAL